MAGSFLDSNTLIYAFTEDVRTSAAEALLRNGPTISVQSLNEFSNVARRKLGFSWTELREALEDIVALCPRIVAIDVETHRDGLRIAERYNLAMFDSLIVASALQADCDTLWSEDMHHDMVIDGRLRIANPFRSESRPG
jgi:predicted nucleic acid-binding protein